ncbi:MAG: hypothetical protein J3K34DRAFT_527609 [Monoraphidium minutum]|nr:MAG: hypothetical protein J3K34DRAFT_527609 [Monoraphidium minutum]
MHGPAGELGCPGMDGGMAAPPAPWPLPPAACGVGGSCTSASTAAGAAHPCQRHAAASPPEHSSLALAGAPMGGAAGGGGAGGLGCGVLQHEQSSLPARLPSISSADLLDALGESSGDEDDGGGPLSGQGGAAPAGGYGAAHGAPATQAFPGHQGSLHAHGITSARRACSAHASPERSNATHALAHAGATPAASTPGLHGFAAWLASQPPHEQAAAPGEGLGGGGQPEPGLGEFAALLYGGDDGATAAGDGGGLWEAAAAQQQAYQQCAAWQLEGHRQPAAAAAAQPASHAGQEQWHLPAQEAHPPPGAWGEAPQLGDHLQPHGGWQHGGSGTQAAGGVFLPHDGGGAPPLPPTFFPGAQHEQACSPPLQQHAAAAYGGGSPAGSPHDGDGFHAAAAPRAPAAGRRLPGDDPVVAAGARCMAETLVRLARSEPDLLLGMLGGIATGGGAGGGGFAAAEALEALSAGGCLLSRGAAQPAATPPRAAHDEWMPAAYGGPIAAGHHGGAAGPQPHQRSPPHGGAAPPPALPPYAVLQALPPRTAPRRGGPAPKRRRVSAAREGGEPAAPLQVMGALLQLVATAVQAREQRGGERAAAAAYCGH